MKELSIEEKAKAYDEVREKIAIRFGSNVADEIFSQFEMSKDEKVRKNIIIALKSQKDELEDFYKSHNTSESELVAWLEKQGDKDKLIQELGEYKVKYTQEVLSQYLEKQGEQSIFNVPIREIILAIWDLGNEWKELTNGCISTEYGTQLDYIQKHWQESEYYLKAKQGERKSAWSEEDSVRLQRIIDFLWYNRKGDTDTIYQQEQDIDWLKSLKDRVQPRQEWNEEDKRKINRIYSILWQAADTHAFSTTCRLISDKECVELQDFLKSLKDKVQSLSQPKEWSEEDERMLNHIIGYLHSGDDFQTGIDWLKSLKQRIGYEIEVRNIN